MNFCSACAAPIAYKIPADDNRLRAVCTACSTVHYVNPKIVLGSLPVWQDKILLCRRAIEPRHGYWTLPAGFMEIDESTQEGAARETLEESGAQVRMGPLFAVMDIPVVQQVHMFYRAEMLSPHLDPGPESLEARLFAESEIPWEDLAFRSVTCALELFFADRALQAPTDRVHTLRLG